MCRSKGSLSVGSQGRFTCKAVVLGAAAVATMIAEAGHHPLLAQGKLDARYSVTLAGLPIGHGSWTVEIGEDHFSTAASGTTAGLMRVFASGQGQSAARGRISGGQLLPGSYVSNIATDQKKYDAVRMVISGGVVKEFAVDPPNVSSANRVPVVEAHRHGVLDPMTASLLRVAGVGDLFVPQACQRRLAVFDGRMRYDLQLAFKRLDRVSAHAGYDGPVVVCSVYFFPIAGHVPDRAAIRYLAELREIEAWFAPIAGTRVLVPYRVSVPTPIGTGVMQATQFISVPQAGKARVLAQ